MILTSIKLYLEKKTNRIQMRHQVNLHPVDQNHFDISQDSSRKENRLN